MSVRDKQSLIVYALAVLILLLIISLVAQGWRGGHLTAILDTPARKMAASPPPETLNLPDDLRVIQDHALFYSTRAFYVPALATPITTSAQISSYQLLGTMLVPEKPGVAFLRRTPSDTTMTLSPGVVVDGWSVTVIQSGRIVFSYKDQMVTLTTKAAATQGRE